MNKLLVSLAAAALLSLAASSAIGAEKTKPVEGSVVRIADGELIVDVGESEGVPSRATVLIYRRLEVTHPVTQEEIVDRFLIGTLRLDQVGSVLSISRNHEGLSRAPKVGDFVVYLPHERPAHTRASAEKELTSGPPKAGSDDSSGSAAGAPKAGAEDSDRAAVDDLFFSTLGQPITRRIDRYVEFLKSHSGNRYAEDIEVELAWMRNRLDEERRLAEERASQKDAEKAARTREAKRRVDGITSAPSRVAVDRRAPVVATFTRPENVEEARAFIRIQGAPRFEEIAMEPYGTHAWRADLPAQFTSETAEVQYFVEAVRRDGQLERAGEGIVEVYEPPVDPAPVANRSRARVESEFVDFKIGDGVDQYWRMEADYRYELDQPWLDGFRVGAGIFDGEGASVAAIEDGRETRSLSLAYGFAEMDWAAGRYFGTGAALLLGNRQGDNLDTFQSSFGLRAFVRLGPEDGTRLETGLALIGGLGSEAWINLDLLEIDRVPMRAEVVVTDLPVGEDLGVSLQAGAGYQFTESLSVMGHIAWNARTINHHGPGAGASLNIDW